MKSSGTCIGSRHDLTHTHVPSTHSGFSENGVPHTSHWFNVILPTNIVYFLRVPHFQTQATSSVQYPLSSHHTGWWSGLWPVIICSMFSLGWSKNPITKIGVNWTLTGHSMHKYVQAIIVDLHPGRRLGSWGSGANGWSLCWEILLNKKLDSNFTTTCWNSRL